MKGDCSVKLHIALLIASVVAVGAFTAPVKAAGCYYTWTPASGYVYVCP